MVGKKCATVPNASAMNRYAPERANRTLSVDPWLQRALLLGGVAYGRPVDLPGASRDFLEFQHALKFVGKRAAQPSLGLMTVAACCRRPGKATGRHRDMEDPWYAQISYCGKPYLASQKSSCGLSSKGRYLLFFMFISVLAAYSSRALLEFRQKNSGRASIPGRKRTQPTINVFVRDCSFCGFGCGCRDCIDCCCDACFCDNCCVCCWCFCSTCWVRASLAFC